MITISVCMIVKDEEKCIGRCLESLKGIYDELIIVDTGSKDNTISICKQYTDKIFHFKWVNDFSKARNFSFSKATKDYIYVADADELIDADNRKKFLEIKEVLLDEIDIVQMYYTNQLQFGTTYNYDRELRPKLYKRLREFQWLDPIHEAVRLEPVVYDSEIEIIHKPEESHAKRDFSNFLNAISNDGRLSHKLTIMYAKELYISGDFDDFIMAKSYFEDIYLDGLEEDELKVVQCVLTKCAYIQNNVIDLMKIALKNVADGKASSEVCCVLGEFFYDNKEYHEAVLWYYNALYETQAQLNIQYDRRIPIEGLIKCYEATDEINLVDDYRRLLDDEEEYSEDM